MTLLERVQIRLQDEPKAENTPQLLELCDIASLRICLRVREATLPEMLEPIAAEVVVKLFRRWNYEGISSEGADTISTTFVEDVLAEYEDEFTAYRETKAAENYNLLSAPIIITFTKEGKCQIGTADADDTIFTGDAVNGYTLKLTVLNRKTPTLPHTGADAPSLWLLIGLPLAVAGLLILVFRYNKKGGRQR